MTTGGYGGRYGGGYGGRYSSGSLRARIERVRRSRERRLAQEAAQAQLAQVAQRSAPTPTPSFPAAPPPKPEPSLLRNLSRLVPGVGAVEELQKGNILGTLGGIFTAPPVAGYRLYNQFLRNVATPAGSAYLAGKETRPGLVEQIGTLGMSTLIEKLSGSDLEAEERRRAESKRALRAMFRGDVSPLAASRTLTKAQLERPLPLQMVSEAVSPVGLAEMAIPYGKVVKAIKPVSTVIKIGTKESDVARRVMELPPVETLLEMVSSTGGIQRKPGIKQVVGIVSPNAVANVSDPVWKVEALSKLIPEVVADAATAQQALILRRGPANRLFEVFREGTRVQRLFGAFKKQVPGPVKYRAIRKATGAKEVVDFTEIAQFPERFALNPAQMGWLDDFQESTMNLMNYAIATGAVEDTILTKNMVKGRYFPNFWKFFDGELMDDLTGVKPSLAVKQNFEKSRFYEEARDAVARGFNGGDPDEAVAILYRSIYKRIGDKHLEDMVRPLGNTIDDRTGDHIVKAAFAANKRRLGVLRAQGIINLVSAAAVGPGRVITRGPRKGTLVRKSFKGRTEAEREAPELMEAFWKASVLGGPARKKAFKELKAQAEALKTQATKQAKEIRASKARARRAAQPRQSELQLPMSGISDVVFTAKEDLKRIIGKADEFGKLKGDIKSVLSREQLKRLQAVLKPQSGKFEAAVSGVAAVSAAARTSMAALDMGVGLIHGLPTLFTKPDIWARSTAVSLATWLDPAVQARFIDQHWDTYQKLLSRNGVHGGGSEYVEALRQGGILQQLTSKGGKLPVVGPIARGAENYLTRTERQFNGFILSAKMLLYEALEPVALRKGGEAALDDLVGHVGKMTGTVSMANMGTSATVREALGGFVLFAPRYRMAVYGLMKDVLDVKSFRGELARNAMGKMMAGGLIMYSVMAAKAKQTPKLDPRKADFLTLKIGGANIGFGSGFVSLARFAAGMIAGPEDDWKLDAGVIGGHVLEKTGRFVRGQAAPTTGVGWDIASGRNYIGEPTVGAIGGLKNSIAEHTVPFFLQGLMDSPRPGWQGMAAEFGGMRAFPVSSYERAVDAADVHSQVAYGQNYRELNRLQQETIRRDNAGVQAMFDESNRIWIERGRANEITLYREAQKEVRDIYDEEVSKKIALLVANTPGFDAEQFRKSVSSANAYMRLAYGRLEEDHPEAVEALQEEFQNPDAHIEDIAYTNYVSMVVAGDFEDPETGVFDFRARERAKAGWRELYGENIWGYVQKRRNLKVEPLLQQLYEGRDRYRPYYEVGELILRQMGAGELVERWQEYVKARGIDKEEIELENPLFKQVKRAQSRARRMMREQNAELDAFLYRWQYTDTLVHPANEGRERELLSYD